jgi:hypothetical protein
LDEVPNSVSITRRAKPGTIASKELMNQIGGSPMTVSEVLLAGSNLLLVPLDTATLHVANPNSLPTRGFYRQIGWVGKLSQLKLMDLAQVLYKL